YGHRRMARGHRGSLLPRCRALSSPPSCRFIPALSASAGGGTLRRHKMGPTTLKPPCTPSSWSSTTRRAASSPKAATQSQRHPLAGERELRSDGWAAGAAVLLDHHVGQLLDRGIGHGLVHEDRPV